MCAECRNSEAKEMCSQVLTEYSKVAEAWIFCHDVELKQGNHLKAAQVYGKYSSHESLGVCKMAVTLVMCHTKYSEIADSCIINNSTCWGIYIARVFLFPVMHLTGNTALEVDVKCYMYIHNDTSCDQLQKQSLYLCYMVIIKKSSPSLFVWISLNVK